MMIVSLGRQRSLVSSPPSFLVNNHSFQQIVIFVSVPIMKRFLLIKGQEIKLQGFYLNIFQSLWGRGFELCYSEIFVVFVMIKHGFPVWNGTETCNQDIEERRRVDLWSQHVHMPSPSRFHFSGEHQQKDLKKCLWRSSV